LEAKNNSKPDTEKHDQSERYVTGSSKLVTEANKKPTSSSAKAGLRMELGNKESEPCPAINPFSLLS
jgi:hypothetical protein